MVAKEVSEIRRRMKRERANITNIYGCYVNDNKEIIAQFSRGTATMPEDEAEKYFKRLRRVLGGTQADTIGKTLLEINFRTAQVADECPEHKLLMSLRGEGIKDDEARETFYRKVIESLEMDTGYLILLAADSYDVPFKNKNDDTDADQSEETYNYILCAICPVKQTKSVLHYKPDSMDFQDGNMVNAASAPEIGFLFPAFDNRSANIYSALYYNRSKVDLHTNLVNALFNVEMGMSVSEQKTEFNAVLAESLEDECSMAVVQDLHRTICQHMELHKEAKVKEPLVFSKNDISKMLVNAGVSDKRVEQFEENFSGQFGESASLHPENLVNKRSMQISLPDIEIRVKTEARDLVSMTTINGVPYVLIQAGDSLSVDDIEISLKADSKEEK